MARVLGGIVLALALAVLLVWRRRPQSWSVSEVSEQWLADHRREAME